MESNVILYHDIRISKRIGGLLGPSWLSSNSVDVSTNIKNQNLRRVLSFLARYALRS
jgi:hypothetical protein